MSVVVRKLQMLLWSVFWLSVAMGIALPAQAADTCSGNSFFFGQWGGATLTRSDFNGGGSTTLNLPGTQNYNLAIDRAQGRVFASSYGGFSISRVNTDGTGLTTLYNRPNRPFAIVYDEARDLIYWTEWTGNGSILCAPADGSASPQPLISGLYYPTGLAFDSASGNLYWYESYSNPRRIRRGAIQNNCGPLTGVSTILSSNSLGLSYDLALVPTLGKLFWTGYDNRRVGSVNLDGSGANFDLYGQLNASGTNLDYHAGTNRLYMILGNGQVRYASPSGGPVSTAFTVSTTNWSMRICEDTSPPALLSFSSTTASGSYGPGAVVTISAQYDEPLAPGSTITVLLNNGVSLTLDSVSGSFLTGTYSVGATGSGEDTPLLDVSQITVENVVDISGNNTTNSPLPGAPNRLSDSRTIVIDTTPPQLSELIPVASPTTDVNPAYTFSSSEAGSLQVTGDCDSDANFASLGSNTIQFADNGAGAPLDAGEYSNCALQVVDAVGNASTLLSVSSFEVVSPGPGGIGSDLVAWLRADAGVSVATDGAAVQEMLDQSGNGNRAYENTFNERPTYRDSAVSWLNYNPLVEFDGNNDRLAIDNDGDINTGTSERKSFSLVFRTGANINGRQVVYEQGRRDRGLNVYINSGQLYFSGWNTSNNGAGSPWGWSSAQVPIASNTPYLLTFVFEGNASETGEIRCFLNGALVGTISGVGRLYGTNGRIGLGWKNNETRYETGQSTGNGQHFEGAIGEFIYYNDLALSVAQRQRLESYLAVKYGFTLDQSTPQNYFSGSGEVIFNAQVAAAGGGHDEFDANIAGIARDPISQLVQTTSKSIHPGALVEVSAANNLDDNEFLLWGHQAGPLSWEAVSSMPQHVLLQRLWRFDETGDVGTVTITVDGASLPALLEPSNQYALVVDSDGDFSSGAQSYPLVLVGPNRYQALGVEPGGDSYFTIAERDAVLPSLLSFSSTTADGTYGPTSEIRVSATYSEPLFPTSSLQIQLNNGTSIVLSPVSATVLEGTYIVGATGSGEDSPALTVDSILSEQVIDLFGNIRTNSAVPASPNNLGDAHAIAVDVTAPTVAEVAAVSSPTTDRTPEYQFSSDEAGDILFTGSCSSATSAAASGVTSLELAADSLGGDLSDGTYSDCALRVRDSYGNDSNTLSITAFVVAATPPVVSLSSALGSIAEGGSTTVTASASNSYAQDIVVSLSYSGTASASDYTGSISILIPAGSTSGSSALAATQDPIDEDTESVVITISNLSAGTGIGSNVSVDILDDDPEPTVTVQSSAGSVGEADGQVTIQVSLSAASGRDVTATMGFAGTATLGQDYSIAGAQVVIPAGATSGSLVLTIIDDNDAEAEEVIEVSVLSVVNASLGSPQQVQIQIVDNDLACNQDPWAAPPGSTGMLVVKATQVFDPYEAYTPPSGSDFESILLGRDAAAQAARKASAVNYFLTTYGIDFSGSDIAPDGASVLVHAVLDLRYQQTLLAASEERLLDGAGEVYEVVYALVTFAETTFYGAWGGVAGTIVPQGTVAYFGESVLYYQVPCTDGSTEARSEYLHWESQEPTFDNGLDSRLHQETVISGRYGVGVNRGRRQVRNLDGDLAEILIENFISFGP